MKRRAKDVGQWDHTNAMGWGILFIFTLPIALILSAIISWWLLPTYLMAFKLSVMADATELYDDEGTNV